MPGAYRALVILVTASPDNLANVAMRCQMRQLRRRFPVAAPGSKRREQRGCLGRLLLVPDLPEDPQCLGQRRSRLGLATCLGLRHPEALERARLAIQRAECPVLRKRFLESGDRFIKTALPRVDNPEIVQRVPLRQAANFAAYVKRLQIALGRRVKIVEPEVDLAEI